MAGKLTLKELEEAAPNSIFRAGNAYIDGIWVRWVAVRGTIPDWSIYLNTLYKADEWIKDYGNKVYSPDIIEKLVPFENHEVFQKYRL